MCAPMTAQDLTPYTNAYFLRAVTACAADALHLVDAAPTPVQPNVTIARLFGYRPMLLSRRDEVTPLSLRDVALMDAVTNASTTSTSLR